ncbi:MAG: PorV/PorQ family protein [Elusimicrobiota bacterium]
MKKFVVLLMTVCITMVVAGAAFSAEGTTAMSFLRIGAGARAAGMGEAFTALSDDASGVYWNPAGIVHVKKMEVSAMYLKWIGDLNYEFIGFVMPKDKMAMGFGFYRLGMEPFAEIDSSGNDTGTSLSYSGMAFAGSFGIGFNKALSVGANAKLIMESLVDKSAMSIGVDVGALYAMSDRIRFGANLHNIGTQLQSFGETKEDLPVTVNIGAYFKAMENSKSTLNVLAEAVQPSEGKTNFRIGGELWMGQNIALRLGYKINTTDSFTLGGSLYMGKLKLDLAYIPYGDWDVTYRAAVSYVF